MIKIYILFCYVKNFLWFNYLLYFYPKGNWIETAKNIEFTGNVLCAKLNIVGTTKFNKSCIKIVKDEYIINDGGKFDKIYRDETLTMYNMNYVPKGNWYINAKDIYYFPNRICAKLYNKIWFTDCVYYSHHDYLINSFGQFKKLSHHEYIVYKYNN